MTNTLLVCSGILCMITALIHSILGEQKIIGPLLDLHQGVMQRKQARQVTRLAWHWTSVLWCLIGLYLLVSAWAEVLFQPYVIAIGLVHLSAGIFDGVLTRGKHIGWFPITLIGVLVLAACISDNLD